MSFGILNIAATGCDTQFLQMQVIANNISNINTNGYKSADIRTSDLFYKTLKQSGIQENADLLPRPSGIHIGLGSRVNSTTRNWSQGELINTNAKLDVAILKTGFFAINLPNGQRGYTRSGSFRRDGETGNIVDFAGRELSSDITIPQEIDLASLTISRDGTVYGKQSGGNNEPVELGRIEIFTFNNLDGLDPVGDNTYLATEASGDEIQIEQASVQVQQGWTEKSNVNLMQEIINLIQAHRSYEAITRVIKIADEVSKETINIKS